MAKIFYSSFSTELLSLLRNSFVHRSGNIYLKLYNSFEFRCFFFQTITQYGGNERYKSDLSFITYSTGRNTHPFRDKSGAYIFLPDGPAKVVLILVSSSKYETK